MSINVPTHTPMCPRYGLVCECKDCLPPVCLCDVVTAIEDGNPEALRIAFYEAKQKADGS